MTLLDDVSRLLESASHAIAATNAGHVDSVTHGGQAWGGEERRGGRHGWRCWRGVFGCIHAGV